MAFHDVAFANPFPSQTVRILAGDRVILRAAQRLGGCALLIAALGLWMAPGASWDANLMLFKLVLSVCAVMTGLGLILASNRPGPPVVEFDTRKGMVRVVSRLQSGQFRILQSCAFDDLSHVERHGSMLQLWDKQREFLAEVTLDDAASLSSVLDGLRRAGKVV